MKYYSILLSALLLLAAGCSKEEVSTYDTSRCCLNLWVGTQAGAVYETATYNYSYAYEEGEVTFYAQISGMPSSHDRTFRLEAYGDDLEKIGNTIRTEEYVIPAGQIGGTYQVHFNTQLLSDPNLDNLYNDLVSASAEAGVGETDVAETVDPTPFLPIAQTLSSQLRHRAMLDVDCFVSPSGDITVLEMNCRFGGQYPFTHNAGVNVPLQLVRWLQGLPTDPALLTQRCGVRSCKDINPVIF